MENPGSREKARPPVKRENTVLMDGVELPAKYKIIYSHHDRQNDPGDVEFEGEKPDCIVLERGRMHTTEDGVRAQMHAQYRLGGQYKHVIAYAAKQEVPIYLVDYHQDLEDTVSENDNLILPALSATGSFLVIQSLIQNGFTAFKNKSITRRGVFNITAKTIAGAYLSLPLVNMATFSTDEPDETLVVRQIHKGTRKTMSDIQPWSKSMRVQGRNIIFAMILEDISKELQAQLNRRPNIPFVVGGGHSEIESEIGKSRESLMQELSAYVDDKKDVTTAGSIIKIEFVKREDNDNYDMKITLPRRRS